MPKPPRNAPPIPTRSRPATRPAAPAATTQAVERDLAAARAATPSLRREAEVLVAEVLRRKADIGTGFYAMGRALAELLDRKLYVALGFANFAALVEQRKLMSRALAWRLISIYRSIPRQTAEQLGPQRAFEWLQVLRTEAAQDAGPGDVRRLAGEPAVVDGRPVAEMKRGEIAELRRKMAERSAAGRRDPGAADAHRTARALAQVLRHLGAEDASVAARFTRSGWRLRVELSVAAGRAVVERKP